MLEQTLQLKLGQRLVLTPALQQAIKLLPLARLELVDLLNQEVVENPLLEEVSGEDTAPADQVASSDVTNSESLADTWDEADYASFFGEYLDGGYRPRTPREYTEVPSIEATLSTASSLSGHLTEQLSAQLLDDAQLRPIGVAIIGNLDEDGYLAASVPEIAAMGRWSQPEVERALALVQGFDPIGVAARDLQECLLLQLRALGLQQAPSEVIVRNHLGLLGNRRLHDLARELDLPVSELRTHIEVIRRLDARPGARYNPTPTRYITPDVYIDKVEDEYVVRINDDGLPQLRISPVYRQMLHRTSSESAETRSYVKDKLRSALWLIKSIDQRQKTIYKVATSIIGFQHRFLDHGLDELRPLVLRDVADDIGMHESTVSRVVTNKYVHTPQGVFGMKFFFHSGIRTTHGERLSSVVIKQRVRALIHAEDAAKPLSDARIVQALEQDGLIMARRTIAKYREELRIPTSSRRRAGA